MRVGRMAWNVLGYGVYATYRVGCVGERVCVSGPTTKELVMIDEPHEARACGLLEEKLDAALDHIAAEFDVTNAAMIGILISKAHELLHEGGGDTE